jgi:5'(3')-deoxyribonucleotidase
VRVLVDCDGVIADYGAFYLTAVYAVTGRRYSPADVTTWSYSDCLGLTPADEILIEAWMNRAPIDIPEIPGAVEAVRRIAGTHDVVFVTAPHAGVREWVYWRQRWLETRFPGLPVVHTARKDLVWGDALIDDRPENLEAWATLHGTGLLMDAPYNTGRQSACWWRVSDWNDVTTALELLTAEGRR